MKLKQRAVAGIGVGYQHGIGQMLAQHVGISDRNHVVENSVRHKAWLSYFAKFGKTLAAESLPGAKGRNLSPCDIGAR